MAAGDAILLELGGVDRILLEDGTGVILIENQAVAVGAVEGQINTSVFATKISTLVNSTEVSVRA